jgi:hypothetical protein
MARHIQSRLVVSSPVVSCPVWSTHVESGGASSCVSPAPGVGAGQPSRVVSRLGESCRVMSRRVESCQVLSSPVESRRFVGVVHRRALVAFPLLSDPIVSCPVESCPVPSRDGMSRPVASCQVTSPPLLSDPVISRRVESRPVPSSRVTSCRVESCHLLPGRGSTGAPAVSHSAVSWGPGVLPSMVSNARASAKVAQRWCARLMNTFSSGPTTRRRLCHASARPTSTWRAPRP